MKNILLKIGIILGTSFISSVLFGIVVAVLVGFLVYNVINGHSHILEIASLKVLMGAIVSPVGIIGGIIGGLIGWATAKNKQNNNKRIAKWSAIGALLSVVWPACGAGIMTIT